MKDNLMEVRELFKERKAEFVLQHKQNLPYCDGMDMLLEELEDQLVCPLTLSKMIDPVISTDGHVFERESITQVKDGGNREPFSRKSFTKNKLRPNYLAKHVIDIFKRHNSRYLQA